MTLAKGDKLFKVASRGDGWATAAAARVVAAVEKNTGPVGERELADALSGGESYVVHEVITDVHYQAHLPEMDFTFAPAVDLKVIY